jgi:DNA-binding response OmpR family regulator
MMKTILVLDDEISMREPLCRLLQLHGYRALKAGDAEEALQQFHNNDCEIDLLIADVSLPIGSGVQVAVALREKLPELGVILATGYPSQMWRARDYTLLGKLGPDSISILQKPFATPTLLAAIDKLIGGGQTQTARTA